MNNYFKQIVYDLRYQRIVTITSALGTAFAIFLVMAVFIISSINSVPVAPESNRPRLLTGKYLEVHTSRGSGSGDMTYAIATELYKDLEGVEKMSYVKTYESMDGCVADGDIVSMDGFRVDENFYDIFDFKFLSGKPFDKATVEANLPEVILQKDVARRLFGSVDIVGREMLLNHTPYTVRGVVDNTSPLLGATYANFYLPYKPESESEIWNDYGGYTSVQLLLAPGTDPDNIRQQVKSRYATLNSRLAKEDAEAIYHLGPYTTEITQGELWSNGDPDTTSDRNMRYLTYAILLILPAINISSMTRSRLRRRVSEIGVRRAYGATKWNIFSRFISENLILTIAGGIIGLILCVVFVLFFCNLFITFGGMFGTGDIATARPTFAMLMNFKSFGAALVFCLLLNIMSTGLPAWRASRVNPAEAISGKN